MVSMGLGFGLGLTKSQLCKRKFRWLLKIPNVCAQGINTLPPITSARPKIDLKEVEARHLNETVYFPVRPEWSPIQLSVYDISLKHHPIFEWLKCTYKPSLEGADWIPPLEPRSASEQNEAFPLVPVIAGLAPLGALPSPLIQPFADLELYDGCGNCIEHWVYEDVWPSSIDFGNLDMSSNEFVTCDITLRYARAYLQECERPGGQQRPRELPPVTVPSEPGIPGIPPNPPIGVPVIPGSPVPVPNDNFPQSVPSGGGGEDLLPNSGGGLPETNIA